MKIPILKANEASKFKGCTLTYGHFNSYHPGHIRYLRHASAQGNKLVIAILSDTYTGKTRSYQFNQRERADGLAALNFIDGIIFINDAEYALLNVIKFLNPNLLVLGKEFEKSTDIEILTAIQYINDSGKMTQFHAGEINMLLHNY